MLVALSTVGGHGDAFGQERPPARVDHYGDPLPEGAVARLGTLRLVHLGQLMSVAVSPDGRVVASGVQRGEQAYRSQETLVISDRVSIVTRHRVTRSVIRLWDAGSGKLVREINTPDAPVSSLFFGPGGTVLYAGCGRFVAAFDVSTGKTLWQHEAVQDGRFHGGVVAERIQLTGDQLVTLHGGRLVCEESRDGGVSFYYHPQKIVRLWDRKTGKQLPLAASLESSVGSEPHISRLLHDVAVSPDGKYAAIVLSQADPKKGAAFSPFRPEESWKYSDRKLQLIEMKTGKVVHTLPDTKNSFGGLTFSDDGSTLASAAGNEISVVQTEDGQQRTLAKGVSTWEAGLKFFVGGKNLAVLMAGGSERA
jgi:WD40 repeat protein